jgi:hypothetical protein
LKLVTPFASDIRSRRRGGQRQDELWLHDVEHLVAVDAGVLHHVRGVDLNADEVVQDTDEFKLLGVVALDHVAGGVPAHRLGGVEDRAGRRRSCRDTQDRVRDPRRNH